MKELSFDFDNCEKIATGKRGDYVVKCPVSEELRKAIKGAKDCKFLSVSMDEIDLRELLKDDNHIYVNILPDREEFGSHPSARVMVPGSELTQFYAVEVCVLPS